MKPYNEEDSKKKQVKDMFDTIAWRYDTLNHVLSFGIDRSWRRRVVKLVKEAKAKKVLDLATGTGDLAIMLAKSDKDMRITGCDLSQQMLAIGRQKVEKGDLTGQIKMEEGEAENLSYADESFDAVTAAFGVRNFDDIGKGMSEAYRVLNKGGIICILEFGMPKMRIFSWFYRLYFHKVLPRIGRMISHEKKAYAYLPVSVEEFPYGEPFLEILKRVGFENCRIINMFGGVAQIYSGTK